MDNKGSISLDALRRQVENFKKSISSFGMRLLTGDMLRRKLKQVIDEGTYNFENQLFLLNKNGTST